MKPKKALTHRDISADRPGNDPNLDRLGYAPFAKRLAQSISDMPRADGQVLALYGGWGFGKTTMLDYVRHYLNEIETANRPFVISCNPWWFSGHQDLVRAFFSQLTAKIKDRKEFESTNQSRQVSGTSDASKTQFIGSWLGEQIPEVALGDVRS